MSLEEFYLNAPSAVIEYDCIDITHPSFSQPYYIVRNGTRGLAVGLEDGGGTRNYLFYPVKVESLGFKDDIDQGFSMTFGDTGDILPDELDRVKAADGFGVFPVFTYRCYRSDDLTQPIYGPIELEIRKLSTNHSGATFEAKSPSSNDGRTGEVYRIDRFPMLRGVT